MTAAALAVALPFTAPADDTRVGNLAAVGQGLRSNLEQWQQYAAKMQQCQSQVLQWRQQLVDAAQPGWKLCAKAQQTLQGFQEVQRIVHHGSLYLRQLGDLDYYRARASRAQDQSLAGEASEGQSQRTVHLERHH